MNASNVDALIVYDPANMFWLTGYDGWSFYVHQCVVISTDGGLFWYGRGIDAKGAELTTDLELKNIISYPDDYVMTPEKHPMEHLAGILKEKGFPIKVIGLRERITIISQLELLNLYIAHFQMQHLAIKRALLTGKERLNLKLKLPT